MDQKRIFNYDPLDEPSFFAVTKLEDLNVQLQSCTVANSDNKPNEDTFAVVKTPSQLWLAVFDGTTSLRSISALKNQSGAHFASHFLKEAFVKTLPRQDWSPRELLLDLNSQLLFQSQQLGGTLSDTHSLPAAMATIVCLDFSMSELKFAHIGDTYGIIFKHDLSSALFTNDKNNQFDQRMFTLMKQISTEKGISIKQARRDEAFNSALYQMFIDRNNNPNGLGSGLVNGDPFAELYIQIGTYPLVDVDSILIATDGLEVQGQSLVDSKYRHQLFETIKTGGLKALVDLKKESEDTDPEWQHPRFKHSDDASGLYVSIVK